MNNYMTGRYILQLIERYTCEVVEKHLIQKFITINKLGLDKHKYLSDYFRGFSFVEEVSSAIKPSDKFQLDELATYLELIIPIKDRTVNGAFFTPSYIVDFIINEIQPSTEATILDPSCGCGAFLLRTADYIKKNYNKPLKSALKENLYGADILDYNIRRTKILFMLKGLLQGEIIEESDFNLECCDSLKKEWGNKYDAVIGNPPYVKYQDLSEETRGYLDSTWQTTQKGTYNLFFPFFELGYTLLSPEGKLGYITPNNYFTSLAAEPLRKYFQLEQNIYKIVDFNSRKVFDVQTYTAITFLNKEKNENIMYDRISSEESTLDYLNDISCSVNSYSDLVSKKWRLLCGQERQVIKSIESIGTPLKELFNICVGIATLKDELYFIDPLESTDEGYLIDKSGQHFLIEKDVTKPLVKISDMRSETDITNNTRRIIFPYRIINGKAVVIEEEEFSLMYPNCYNYLLSVKKPLEERDKGKNKFLPFYQYGRTQGLSKFGTKLYTPTFSQTPRFLIDSNEESLFTNGYALYIKSGNCLFENLISLPENLDVALKVLNSGLMHYYVSKTSVSIEGGYPCYQKNFIENFTVPSFTQEEIEILRNLSSKEEIDTFLENKYHVNLPSPKRSS